MKAREVIGVIVLTMLGILIPSQAFAATSDATANAGPGRISVSTGTAILTPEPDGGYLGRLPVHLASQANTTGKYIQVEVVAPLGVTWASIPDSRLFGCGMGHDDQQRQIYYCILDTTIPNHQTLDFEIGFASLAAPTKKTRISGPGEIRVSISGEVDPAPANNTSVYKARLIGTGQGVAAQPYTPATQSAYTLTAASAMTFADAGDGTYVGSFEAGLTSASDVPNIGPILDMLDIPAGHLILSIQPSDICFFSTCYVGGAMPQNTRRSFTVFVHVSTPPPAGTTLRFDTRTTRSDGLAITEVTPADNLVTVTVS